MEKIVIGIDPGSIGFMSCIMPNGNIEFKSISESSVDDLNKTLCGWVNKASAYEWGIIVVMEQVHAIFGSSAKATFSFGEIFGVLKGLIMANNIPYHLVQPKEWQSDSKFPPGTEPIYFSEHTLICACHGHGE